MPSFLAEIELHMAGSREFLELIPEQRSLVNRLMGEGVILSYAVAADRSRMWCIIEADTDVEVQSVLDSFPLHTFMVPTVHKLLFHNMQATAMGSISLN
jgi:muconolactone delta-isomerase